MKDNISIMYCGYLFVEFRDPQLQKYVSKSRNLSRVKEDGKKQLFYCVVCPLGAYRMALAVVLLYFHVVLIVLSGYRTFTSGI